MTRLLLFFSVLVVSQLGLGADPRPELADCKAFLSAFGQNLSPKDYAVIQNLKLKNPKIAFIQTDILRRDFPEQLGSKTDAEIRQWVLDNYAYVTEFANDNAGIHHTGLDVEPTVTKSSLVPHTYGRADVMGEPLIDRKGVGVTYVKKTKDGIVLVPDKSKFRRGADHQDGLAKLKESLYETCAGDMIHCVTGNRGAGTGSNEIYFSIDTGAKVHSFSPEGHQYSTDPAVIIGRQGNVRFYRVSPENQEKARDEFLYSNANLFWRGLYHGSMNRYNSDNGVYIDYGTVTGVPNRAFRMTAMSHVPYGLSDFYGMFGEWSAGQAQSPEGNQSPFYPRSWGVFLANLGVATGMPKDKMLDFVKKNESKLGETDLHEFLLKLNENREPEFRSDPTKKTFTKLNLVHITEAGEKGAEDLQSLTDTAAIYQDIARNALDSEPASKKHYLNLLKSATHSDKEEVLEEMAGKLQQVEEMLRASANKDKKGLKTTLANSMPNIGNDRVGEQLLRKRMHQDSVEASLAYEASASEIPAQKYIDRFRSRIETASPNESLGAEKDLKREVGRLSRSGLAPGYTIRVREGEMDRDLPVIVPTAQLLDNPEYQAIRDKTIGLIWRDTRAAGEQYGHAYVRVNDKIYDLQVAKTLKDDFSRMMKNRFFFDFGMAGREGKAPYYETLFPASPEAREELARFLEDRTNGTATIDGEIVAPHFDASGKGEPWGDGIIRENCGAFATCFTRPRWWKDYPVLEKLTEETGVKRPMDGATVALQSALDSQAKPLAFIAWGGSNAVKNPFSQHEVLGFSGQHPSMEVLQTSEVKSPKAINRAEAEKVKDWAKENGLVGYQATALPSVSKSGEAGAPARKFNFIKLDAEKVPQFTKDIAEESAVLWWRWEPNGQYGHAWISVGDKIYDQAAGHYGAEPLNDFFKRENEKDFALNGNKTFFVGLQIKMDPKDVKSLKTFYDARVAGKKSDGTVIPKPDYRFDQPFVKDEITDGRCGMFATSCGNAAWQKHFPELKLDEISSKYGLQYMDGSLAVIHRAFQKTSAPSNFFIIGSQDHVKKEGFSGWDLPADSLPPEMREPLKGAWVPTEKKPF